MLCSFTLRRFLRNLHVKDRLKANLKSALLAKNGPQLTALKNIQAELVNYEKSGAVISQESDYLSALQALKDKYLTTLESYQKLLNEATKAEDAEKLKSLAQKEAAELELLQEFLPPDYSIAEIESLIVNQSDFASAMKTLKDKIDFTRTTKSRLARQLRQIFPK